MEINQLMFLLIDVVLLAIALILLIPVSVLFLECSAAFLSGEGERIMAALIRPRAALAADAMGDSG